MNSTQQQFTYHMPTRIMVGPYIFKKIGAVAKALGTRVLLVTYKDFAESLKEITSVISSLNNVGLKIRIFDEVEPNPDIEMVARGARLAVKDNINLIIGLGGGSAIDAAKGISIVATHGSDIWESIQGQIKYLVLPYPLLPFPPLLELAVKLLHLQPFPTEKSSRKKGLKVDTSFQRLL